MEFDFYTRHFTRKYYKKKKPGEFLWDLCKDYQVHAQFFFNGMGNLPMTKMQFSFYAFRQVGKQAREGFRPPSAMQGIGHFQNLSNFLRNVLKNIWIFFGIFLEFFKRIFREDFLRGFFWEEFFVRNCFGGIFKRNSLFTLLSYSNMEYERN